MRQQEIRGLMLSARLFLRGKDCIKAKRLARQLDISNREAGQLLALSPEWEKPAQSMGAWYRTDALPIPFEVLSLRLTPYQLDFLRDRKRKCGQSLAAQVRELINAAIEGPALSQGHFLAGRSPQRQQQGPRAFTKRPEAAQINAITQELKAIFAKRAMVVPAYIG